MPRATAETSSDAALRLMLHRNARMHGEASTRRGRGFVPRASDVFVATYPKTGTTWCAQVCHQIRCARGGVDGTSFGEITEVVPWDVLAMACGQDLDAEHACAPRVFKSHEGAETIASGGRYVVVVREPCDVFHSFYEFLPAYCGIERGVIDKGAFAEAVFAGASHSGGFAAHYVSWWKALERDPENVIMFCFEDMKENLGDVVDAVSAFMGIELDADARALVLERSGFEYMRNNTKFDDHFVREKVAKQMGMEGTTFTVGKVRDGGGAVGDGSRELPPSVRDAISEKWRAEVAPNGFATYDDFRRELRSRWRTKWLKRPDDA